MNKRRIGFKKFILTVVLSICASFMLISCGTSKEPSVKEITEKISASVDISAMQKADDEKLERFYGISKSELEEYDLYIASNNLKSEEIAVLKVKDEEKVEDIKKAVEDRVSNQESNFKDYLPEEYALVENSVLEVNGKYILLAIHKDAEQIKDEFNKSFK